MTPAKAIPDGYNTVSAHLVVPNCLEASAIYEKAFGAKRGMVLPGPGGSTMHMEMQLGNSTLMMTDENPEFGNKSALSLGGCPITLNLYVEDADATFAKATAAGMQVVMPVADMFWGDRYGQVKDPFGITWAISTHKEDVPEAEIIKRMQAMFGS